MSKSALVLSPCLAWTNPESRHFDDDTRPPEDLVARDNGIAFHDHMDKVLKGDALYPPDGMRKQCAHAERYLDEVLGPRCDTIQSEVAIGVNWLTGKFEAFPEVKDRGYPEREGWQFGTADLVCILKTGELLIADWKTGGTDGATDQLMSLACGFRMVMTASDGHQGNWFRPIRILCLAVNDDGVWPHEQEISADQINSHMESMRFKWEDIIKGGQKYVPGIHCTQLFCPHLAYCGAITGKVETAARMDRTDTTITGPRPPQDSVYTDTPTSNQHAGHIMATISAARRQMKYNESKLKEYITKLGGKVVAGGYEWSDGNNGYRWRREQ